MNIRSIAELAGVSKATASRVINNRPGVSAKLRDAVEAVVLQHGYQVNAVARALARRRTNNVALIIPRPAQFVFASPYFSEVLRGVATAVESQGYNLVVSTSAGADRFHVVNRDGSCDGAIFAGVWRGDLRVADLRGAAVPVVVIGKPSQRPSVPFVTMDDEAGALEATRHLIDRGRTRLAMITARPISMYLLNREKGFARALQQAGVSSGRSVFVDGAYTFDGARSAMAKLLSSGDPPTGVLAANDLMASGALSAARGSGIAVPGDVAIVGFGNVPLSSATNPALTTVEEHLFDVGCRAADLLLRLVRGERPEETRVVLPTHLVIRESS